MKGFVQIVGSLFDLLKKDDVEIQKKKYQSIQ